MQVGVWSGMVEDHFLDFYSFYLLEFGGEFFAWLVWADHFEDEQAVG